MRPNDIPTDCAFAAGVVAIGAPVVGRSCGADVSTLYLIRHGQASFGAHDYDVLSARGERQSRLLGAHFARAGRRIDAVFEGPARRHRDTAALAIEGARENGVELPAPTPLAELDEYPGVALFKRWLPALTSEEPALGALAGGADGEVDPAEAKRAADRAVVRLAQRWSRGELELGDLESFTEFNARVGWALDHIMTTCGRGVTVAAFTSGGTIAAAVRRALGLSADKMLEISWVLANASITELRYRRTDLGLISMNTTPHLREPDLMTRR